MKIDLTDEERRVLLELVTELPEGAEFADEVMAALRNVRAKLANAPAPATSPSTQSSLEKKDSSAT